MPSSYTPLLRLVLPVTGELTGTWGDTVNNGITPLVEAAIAGTANVSMTDANHTLSTANEATDEARQAVINLTGALTASRNVVCPASSKLYIVRNATTGGFPIVFKTAAGTGITVANGTTRFLRCDGTSVVEAFNEFGGHAATAGNVTGVVAVVNGGTGGSTPAAARSALGTNTVPRNTTALTLGEMFVTTTGFTLNTGLTAGNVYNIFNASATPFTLTQGSGLNLRLSGTTLTGNRTIGAWGTASIWIDTTTQYVIAGAGIT